MKTKKTISTSILATSILAALFAITGFIWDAFNNTEPVITAYCKVENFNERPYNSFTECDASLKTDREKYGYVCGCGRSDGIYSVSSVFIKWIM